MEKTFGAQFREWRKQARFTQRELADVLHVSHTYISKIENDRLQVPPSERVLRDAAYHFGEGAGRMIELAGHKVEVPIAEYKRLRNLEAAVEGNTKRVANVERGPWSQVMMPYAEWESDMQFVPRDEADRRIKQLEHDLFTVGNAARNLLEAGEIVSPVFPGFCVKPKYAESLRGAVDAVMSKEG